MNSAEQVALRQHRSCLNWRSEFKAYQVGYFLGLPAAYSWERQSFRLQSGESNSATARSLKDQVDSAPSLLYFCIPAKCR